MKTNLKETSKKLFSVLTDNKVTFGTAESCTGGLIAKTVTDLSGISEYYFGTVVSYSNSVKQNVLKVKESTLKEFGAVSGQTATQMAEGACEVLGCDYAVSTTGIAGPTGGTKEKPVGLVYIACAGKGKKTAVTENHFSGTRKQIREQATEKALCMLIEQIEK